MNIKVQIGQRIQAERLAKGLTRKALEELTDDLKQSRISNWERGDRTPGPEEIKQLAKALDVSPAYLMCLTDEKQPKTIPGLGAIIPVLNYQQATDPKVIIKNIQENKDSNQYKFIPISAEIAEQLSENAFALKINDDSMHPELRVNDVVIVEPNLKLLPGCLVVAKLKSAIEVVVRRYKQLSIAQQFNAFELRSENDNWGNIKIDNIDDAKINGVIVCVLRLLTV